MDKIIKYSQTKGEVRGDYYFRGIANGCIVFDNYNRDFPFYITIPVEDIKENVSFSSFVFRVKKRMFSWLKKKRNTIPVTFSLHKIIGISSKAVKVNLPNGQYFFVVDDGGEKIGG